MISSAFSTCNHPIDSIDGKPIFLYEHSHVCKGFVCNIHQLVGGLEDEFYVSIQLGMS